MKTILILSLLMISLAFSGFTHVTSKQADSRLWMLDTLGKNLLIKDSTGLVLGSMDSNRFALNDSVELVFNGKTTADWLKVDSVVDQTKITIGDDYGIEFQGQLSALGEFIAGKDSYPVPLAFHCSEDSTSGLVVTGCTNITTILQSDISSATGLFGDTVIGSYILVASPERFWGIKTKYDTLGVVDPDSMAVMYLRSEGEGFVQASIMGTNSTYPYQQEGYRISNYLSEHIFFGYNPFEEDSVWQPSQMTINGTPYDSLFWGKYCTIGTIVKDPVVQQVKLHTSRIEVEDRGIFKFGKARTAYSIKSGFDHATADANSTPSNSNVTYNASTTFVRTNNLFVDNKDDAFDYLINREEGLDTSIPLIIEVTYAPQTTATGIVQFYIHYQNVFDPFTFGTSNTYDSLAFVDNITVDSQYTRRTVKTLVPIYKLFGNSSLVLKIGRNALAGNAEDTFAGNTKITNVVISGFKWKL